MEIKLDEDDIKAALDFWLRSKHQGLVEAGNEVTEMDVNKYPLTVNLKIGKPPIPIAPPAPPGDEIPF